MILFIAPNPTKQKKIEGYLQRVSAIDKIFSNDEKIYSDDLTHKQLYKYMAEADIIYVHSIYKSLEILPHYQDLGYKIITDLHGVVPEEEKMMGNIGDSKTLHSVEKTVFKYGKYFVAVTEAMVEYYKKKYSQNKFKKFILLPIFNANKPNIEYSKYDKDLSVVYAGGGQKWQNIDMMVKAANNDRTELKYNFLTQDISKFDKIRNKRAIIKAVAPSEVFKYYDQSSMGFILRSDSVVNKVACPTKLIEYIAYGVVPVVYYDNIGDFKKLGYKYINYNDFISKKYTKNILKKLAQHNLDVYGKLKKVEELGTLELTQVADGIKKENNIDSDFVLRSLENYDKLIDLNVQIDKLSIELAKEKDKSGYYEDELSKIFNSKKWKTINALGSLTAPNAKKKSKT